MNENSDSDTGDMFPLGSKWIINSTDRNATNGLARFQGAYLRFADPGYLSIVSMQPGMPERKVPRHLFGINFKRSPAGEIASAYIASKHATTLYQ
ncbi:MAG: hypothetical protein AAGA12_03380 [Pseudomonadota bacterium]